MSYRQIKIGTRGSPLAMWQTNEVLRLIRRKFPSLNTKVIIIKTSGDKFSGSLSTTHDSRVTNHDYAGKGLFVKEMEEALASGRIDMAVHSLKDMPAILPKGLSLVAYLKREDPSDLFISKKYKNISSLPKGAVFGTSSPRRKAQVLSVRPDLRVIPLRGNVATRLEKLLSGECEATILANAGVKRLDLTRKLTRLRTHALTHFIPAIGQGIISVETRTADKDLIYYIRSSLNDAATESAALAERAFLKKVTGDCHTPIAAYAQLKGKKVVLKGFASSPSGKKTISASREGSNPSNVGRELGAKFVKLGARKLMRPLVLFTGLRCDRKKFQGSDVVHLPLIKILPPSDNYRSLDSAIKRLNEYDWLVFTSQTAVERFFERITHGSWRKAPKIAAVGPTTAEKVRSYGRRVDLMPGLDFNSAELARKLLIFKVQGLKILFPRAKEGKDALVKELSRMGAHVDLVEAYRTVPNKINVKKWKALFKKRPPDEVVIQSESADNVFKKYFHCCPKSHFKTYGP